eukprot:gnl/TRDRNA2_/TRDRNA2_167169_c1_seq2.p1 gnl/TRDRNA2_/TRDRNA2_167169_c1~~gnl/TRDRNA2_/TRDRNA2_167169_c1_seq2.p1  ORF type:complete len:849 (-),score=166.45 gnl/TRDRNA2_/TRDRNA2_167169_c1_seq2:263-2809(-)
MARERGSVGSHFHKQCPQWKKQSTYFDAALQARYGDDRAFWPHEDFFGGDYRCIMFESLHKSANGKASLSEDIPNRFKNDFIAALANFVPVIALHTYGSDRLELINAMRDHAVTRGLPLMLLDTRVREPEDLQGPQNIEQCKKALDAVIKGTGEHNAQGSRSAPGGAPLCEQQKGLHDWTARSPQGLVDTYNTCVLGFVKHWLNSVHQFAAEETGEAQKGLWLYDAISVKLPKKSKKTADKEKDDEIDKEEKLEEDLVAATNLVMHYVGAELEWESVTNQARCEAGIEGVKQAKDWSDLKKRVEDHWNQIRTGCFHSYKELRELCEENDWCELQDLKVDTVMGRYKLVIDDEAGEWLEIPVQEGIDSVTRVMNNAFRITKKYDALGKTERAFCSLSDKWMAVYDVLKAPDVTYGNVHALRKCQRKMFAMAQIDRLPSENELTTLVLLRRAWTLVDVFNASAYFYKIVSKACFILTLLMSSTVIVLTTLMAIYPNMMDVKAEDELILCLALGASFINGWVTMIDPNRKWRQLKGGALSLESEIWKFRTRVGDYQGEDMSSTAQARNEKLAEERLYEMMKAIQGKVLHGGGLKETSFFATPCSTDDVYVDKEAQEKNMEDDTAYATPFSKFKRRLKNFFQGPADESRGQNTKMQKAHFLHGQYKDPPMPGWRELFSKKTTLPSKPGEGCDNFHSPSSPHEYVRWRLIPQLRFYQHRIPRYSFQRKLFMGISVAMMTVSSILAALDLAHWCAIITALITIISAIQAFNDTIKKLERYSAVAGSLMDVLMGWQAANEVDQQNLRVITQLVDDVEALLSSDHAAWLSDSQKANKLASLAKDKDAKPEKGESPS